MLTTPSAKQSYQLFLETRYISSVLVNSQSWLESSGIDLPDKKSAYIQHVASMVFVYKHYVDKSIYKSGGSYFYNPGMTDKDDTLFAKLYIILKNIVSKESSISTPPTTNSYV